MSSIRTLTLTSIPLIIWLALAGASAYGEVQIEEVTDQITVVRVGSKLSSNISVFSGSDGLFVADTGVARSREKVLAAVASVSDQPVRFVVNTHWHFDHVGNNEGMHTHSHDHKAVVIAHTNVRERMLTGQHIPILNRTVQPSNPDALPVITYDNDSQSSPTHLHFNGEDINIFAVDPAHTDGDSVVVWPKARVC